MFVQQTLGDTRQYSPIQLHRGLRFPRSPRLPPQDTLSNHGAGRAALLLLNSDFGENSSLRPTVLGKMTATTRNENLRALVLLQNPAQCFRRQAVERHYRHFEMLFFGVFNL